MITRGIMFLFLIFGALPSILAQAVSTQTLVIAAQSIEGNPLPGVSFEASAPAFDYSQTAQTNNMGITRISVPAGASFRDLHVDLRDPRYQMPEEFLERTRGDESPSRFLFARLIPAKVAQMSALERSAYVDMMPDIYRERWSAGKDLPEDRTKADPLVLATFLEGFGEEAVPDFEKLKAQAKGAAEARDQAPQKPIKVQPVTLIAVQVVNQAGAPVSRRRVLLFELADQAGKLQIANGVETNRDGMAYFSELKEGNFYRPLVLQDRNGFYAPGPILKPQTVKGGPGAESRAKVTTLVLRERTKNLSGVVFRNGVPARGVRLWTEDILQPTVETRSGEYGYFELSPLRPGETTLKIEDPATLQEVELSTIVGGNEVLVPLEILLKD